MNSINNNTSILNDSVIKNVLGALAVSLSNKQETFNIDIDLWPKIKKELELHTVLPLVSVVKTNPTLPEKYKIELAKQTAINIRMFHEMMQEQSNILETFKNNNIQAVILKGVSAGQYYPRPELRVYGDIDILVLPNDFAKAFNLLCSLGYQNLSPHYKSQSRHGQFISSKGMCVELHHHLSISHINEQNVLFEDLLNKNIKNVVEIRIDKYVVPMFPTVENGLILLDHINHHLINGLGFRQIIDWMLFVRNNLTDNLWNNEFQKKAESLGLDYLAKVVTKMCQTYFGLSQNINWCKDINNELVDDLILFIFNNGNFGRKKSIDSHKSATVMHQMRNPIYAFRYISNLGIYHMEKEGLKPNKLFAWFYQIRHLFIKFISSKDKRGIFNGIKRGTKDNDLMKRLRVTRL